MVGNGATDWRYDVHPSFAATAANFNIIPQKLLKEWEDEGCFYSFHDVLPKKMGPKCDALVAISEKLKGKSCCAEKCHRHVKGLVGSGIRNRCDDGVCHAGRGQGRGAEGILCRGALSVPLVEIHLQWMKFEKKMSGRWWQDGESNIGQMN